VPESVVVDPFRMNESLVDLVIVTPMNISSFYFIFGVECSLIFFKIPDSL
jgi:hypothetical protein